MSGDTELIVYWAEDFLDVSLTVRAPDRARTAFAYVVYGPYTRVVLEAGDLALAFPPQGQFLATVTAPPTYGSLRHASPSIFEGTPAPVRKTPYGHILELELPTHRFILSYDPFWAGLDSDRELPLPVLLAWVRSTWNYLTQAVEKLAVRKVLVEEGLLLPWANCLGELAEFLARRAVAGQGNGSGPYRRPFLALALAILQGQLPPVLQEKAPASVPEARDLLEEAWGLLALGEGGSEHL